MVTPEEDPGIEPPENEELEESCRFNGQEIPSLDDLANASVREAATADSQWVYTKLLSFLYKWADIFNQEFFDGKLPQPIISFEKTRKNNLGHFVPGRNSLGLKFNVNLNRMHLGKSEADLLETLCRANPSASEYYRHCRQGQLPQQKVH
jgi:hypothetical protein